MDGVRAKSKSKSKSKSYRVNEISYIYSSSYTLTQIISEQPEVGKRWAILALRNLSVCVSVSVSCHGDIESSYSGQIKADMYRPSEVSTSPVIS